MHVGALSLTWFNRPFGWCQQEHVEACVHKPVGKEPSRDTLIVPCQTNRLVCEPPPSDLVNPDFKRRVGSMSSLIRQLFLPPLTSSVVTKIPLTLSNPHLSLLVERLSYPHPPALFKQMAWQSVYLHTRLHL